jgi:uncharacterized protein with FMN-binding domain
MRKLLLSVGVIAVSGLYVAAAATSKDHGVQALLDRVSFRPAPAHLPPLDPPFDDGLLAPLGAALPAVPLAPAVIATPATAAPAPATPPPPVVAPALAPATSTQYRDGTYTGKAADAYYGLVQVRAHVRGGRLTSVDVLEYPSDRHVSREISGYVLPILQTEAIEAQDAAVDLVTGATLTAIAYIRSLNTALGQAQ